jgi:hypothetical protein
MCRLRRLIKERFDVDLDEVSIGRVLKKLGFAHVQAALKSSPRSRPSYTASGAGDL